MTRAADVLRRVRTLADIATEQLRHEILAGSLSPGAPLHLQPIAERLGMSITPVREALRRLAAEGFVEIENSRAARVALIDLRDLEDVYSMRILIEVDATRRAVSRLDEAGFARIEAALAEYRSASEAEYVEAAREAHQAFHFAIYEASGSAWTMRCIQPLWNNSERYQRIARAFRGTPRERVQEHAAILEACRRRDADEAARLLTAHLERSVDLVRSVLLTRSEGASRGERKSGADTGPDVTPEGGSEG